MNDNSVFASFFFQINYFNQVYFTPFAITFTVNAKIQTKEIQNLHLIANLCAYENIMLSLRLQKNLSKAKEKIYEIAKQKKLQ